MRGQKSKSITPNDEGVCKNRTTILSVLFFLPFYQSNDALDHQQNMDGCVNNRLDKCCYVDREGV